MKHFQSDEHKIKDLQINEEFYDDSQSGSENF